MPQVVSCRALDMVNHINDPAFADAVADRLLAALAEQRDQE